MSLSVFEAHWNFPESISCIHGFVLKYIPVFFGLFSGLPCPVVVICADRQCPYRIN